MNEEHLLATADERIERHRKADLTIRVTDRAGQPVRGATVRMEQTRHAFLFGCNVFPVLSWRSQRKEAAYQRAFTDLLNYATLGFYWAGYEPTPGQTREARLREQAEWCQAHGLATKGHPLVWHEVHPKWGPSDVAETKRLLRARVTEIVSRFAGLVDRWDVVNEATVSAEYDNGVGRWAKQEGPVPMVVEALSWARAANPQATLLYNDYKLDEAGQQLVADLLRADTANVDVLGLQSHMHHAEWELTRVWETCEAYARFGKPLHFTETTVLSGQNGWELPRPWATTPEGEAKQADYVTKLYTLLFSHPAVQAITWWDLPDGQWQGAPAGLLREDLSRKPAYERLLGLVKGAWWTKAEATTDAAGEARVRGFLGQYRITVEGPEGAVTSETEVSRGENNRVSIQP